MRAADLTALPIVTEGARLPSPLERLAQIPEEEIWLQKQKSARTRRAYRLDVQHFVRSLAIKGFDGESGTLACGRARHRRCGIG
jgi:hypothetical protein